jgi:hypothetical protein
MDYCKDCRYWEAANNGFGKCNGGFITSRPGPVGGIAVMGEVRFHETFGCRHFEELPPPHPVANPCPFCGARPIVWGHRVCCPCCDMEGPKGCGIDESIRFWNSLSSTPLEEGK